MSKEIQSRLPNPQRSLTSLYSRPNATGPQAPAPLARPSTTNSEIQIGDALMNLVQPVTQYGVKREQQEIEMLQQQEALKIDKMNIEEQRNYLAKLAREAEQYGTIARGSNFFRIKFAQDKNTPPLRSCKTLIKMLYQSRLISSLIQWRRRMILLSSH